MKSEVVDVHTVLICAGEGDVREARGLVSRAIRAAGLSDFYYIGMNRLIEEGASRASAIPRYVLQCTEAQLAEVVENGIAAAKEEGWSRAPFEAY